MKTEFKKYFQILVLLTVIIFGGSIVIPDNHSDFICTEIYADSNQDISELNSESAEDVFEIQKIVFSTKLPRICILFIRVNSLLRSQFPLSIWQPPRI